MTTERAPESLRYKVTLVEIGRSAGGLRETRDLIACDVPASALKALRAYILELLSKAASS